MGAIETYPDFIVSLAHSSDSWEESLSCVPLGHMATIYILQLLIARPGDVVKDHLHVRGNPRLLSAS